MSTSSPTQSTVPAGEMVVADTAGQQALWDRHDAEQLQLWQRHAELTQQNKDVFTWYALRGAQTADTSNRTAELSVVDMFENPEDLFKAVYNSQSGSSTVDLLRASSVVSANTAWADIKAGDTLPLDQAYERYRLAARKEGVKGHTGSRDNSSNYCLLDRGIGPVTAHVTLQAALGALEGMSEVYPHQALSLPQQSRYEWVHPERAYQVAGVQDNRAAARCLMSGSSARPLLEENDSILARPFGSATMGSNLPWISDPSDAHGTFSAGGSSAPDIGSAVKHSPVAHQATLAVLESGIIAPVDPAEFDAFVKHMKERESRGPGSTSFRSSLAWSTGPSGRRVESPVCETPSPVTDSEIPVADQPYRVSALGQGQFD